MDEVKMFLFARWITTCYADSHLDSKMRCEHDEGFKENEAISVLNRESGYWYKEQLKYFNDVVYPNYIKNGTVDNTKQFLNITICSICPDCMSYNKKTETELTKCWNCGEEYRAN